MSSSSVRKRSGNVSRPVTLGDVAKRCGTTPATVSRVLNNVTSGRFSVSPELRGKIVKAAAELGYRPSVAARNLVAKQTHLIALLGLRLTTAEAQGAIERSALALIDALDDAGYSACTQFRGRRHSPFDLPPMRVDGAVALNASSPADVAGLEKLEMPYVSLNGYAGPHGSMVLPDDEQGMALALEHLWNLGHERIVYSPDPYGPTAHPSEATRLNAFKKMMKSRGLTPRITRGPVLDRSVPDWNPAARSAVIDARAAGITAIIGYSHQWTIALLFGARHAGIRVPEELSLLGFNDEPPVEMITPTLTTVGLPAREMGVRAAQLLLARLAAKERVTPQRVVLPEYLAPRASTGPVSK